MKRIDNYRNIKSSVARQGVEELVEQFNSMVGIRSWTSARAAHDSSLIDSLIKQGIDVSAIYDGSTISFKNHISLNEDKTKIVLV